MEKENEPVLVPCLCFREGLLHNYFVYFDANEYLANKLFVEQKIRLKILLEYYVKDSPDAYRTIVCRVNKRHIDRFIGAIEKLSRNMLLCGHPDYLDFCAAKIAEIIDKLTAKNRNSEPETTMEENS